MSLPPAVDEMLETVSAGVREALGDALVGLYLRGSLATGGFVPETSDLDLLAVTETPIDLAAFGVLAALHEELGRSRKPYARRVEITYLDRAALARFVPGRRHATLGQYEQLAWTEHGPNWILERWAVREHGRALFGPDPRTLIEPISDEALVAAVRARLPDWAAWGRSQDPDEGLPLVFKAYVVETMCRALYTLQHGVLGTKREAVDWAVKTLPEPWRATAERSRAWRADRRVDPAAFPEVRRFVVWATSPNAFNVETGT